ncbi:MAG: glycosyltransferase family 4 protein [Lutibacter sp.]
MKKDILILYNFILHYRIPFFNVLSQYYNVTVLHSGKECVGSDDKFTEIIVPVKKMGPFYFQKGVLAEVNKEKYDIIIALFDIAWVNTIISIYVHNKKAKFILWGAWITKSNIANRIRIFFTKKAHSNVFYTNEARLAFIKKDISKEKLYVANNTFDVGLRIRSYENPVKNSILFVGSLDKRKQNDVLLKSFSEILDEIPSNIMLTIIGDGVERDYLMEISHELKIEGRVNFTGKINDTNTLMNYYKNAIVSVSFGQAGLSVLQSLGYGVPFLTKRNAISGGEKTNIRNNYNGIFCDDDSNSLAENLKFLCNDIKYARTLGENAFNYYSDFCTINNMVQGFKDAIEGTRLALIDEEEFKY